jgi:hypothetical protein
VQAASAARDDVEVRAYVNDTCILADEPYLLPAPVANHSGEQGTTKVLPLVGIMVGKLAELLINYIVTASTNHIKADGARKDTRYAMTKEMNLYRANLRPAPAISLNAKLDCMTIVTAKFQPDPSDCTTWLSMLPLSDCH